MHEYGRYLKNPLRIDGITKQSTAKLCVYLLGYIVCWLVENIHNQDTNDYLPYPQPLPVQIWY